MLLPTNAGGLTEAEEGVVVVVVDKFSQKLRDGLR